MSIKLIAIAGGIGSGKSVVSRALREMGYHVYDCDSEAKALMDSSDAIKARIAAEVDSRSILPDGTIDRPRLASTVFGNPDLLSRLNAIVHSAVRADILKRAEPLAVERCRVMFVETAILYQSGLDRMVDSVWEVTAPVDTRIERVMTRNATSADEVRARIEVQDSYIPSCRHNRVRTIENDGFQPILPAILSLLNEESI